MGKEGDLRAMEEEEGEPRCLVHGCLHVHANHTYPVGLGTLELRMGTGSTTTGVEDKQEVVEEEASVPSSTSCKLLMDSESFMW